MTRLSGDNLSEAQSVSVRPVHLVELFGQYITDNDAPVTYNGNVYVPEAFTITDFSESADLNSRQLTLTFAISSPFASVVGGIWTPVIASLVFLQSNGLPVDGATVDWQGYVAGLDPTLDDDASACEVICQDWFALLDKASGLRFNTIDQQSRPGCATDTFFDALPKQKGQELEWMGEKVGGKGNAADPPWRNVDRRKER